MNYFKRFIILLCLGLFLFIVSCGPNEVTIDIYNYDGDEFVLDQHIVKGKYEKYTLPNVDVEIDGYTLLAWLEIDGAVEYKTIKDLEEAQDINYTVKSGLPNNYSSPQNVSYYPIIIKNEEVTNFVESSKLAQVNVEVCFIFGEKTDTKTYKALLTDTYNDILLGELEQDGYIYLGISKSNKGDYLTNGLTGIEVLDLEEQFVFDGYNRIYVYYEQNK